MKLGILTFHRSINYGAFMQSYALSHEIMRRFPSLEVEVIDFEKLSKHKMYIPSKRGIINKIQYIEKKKQYSRFQEDLDKLSLSMPSLITDDYEKVFEYINSRYDIVVVGSDAVWAYNQKLGLKNPYWLFGDRLKCHKMSYAASAYSLDQSKMTEDEKKYIGDCLQSFDYIGVRDEETKKLVQMCAPNRTIFRNCDPTVLLPSPCREEGEKYLKRLGVDTNKKVVSIMSRGTKYARVIKDYLGSKDYTYINLYQREQFRDRFSLSSPKYLYNLSPTEWYRVYACCTLNITTFFHGTLLGLKSCVPTISFDVTNLSFDYVSKIEQLLLDLRLEENWFCNNIISEEQEQQVLKRVQYLIHNEDNVREQIKTALSSEKDKSESFFQALSEIIL